MIYAFLADHVDFLIKITVDITLPFWVSVWKTHQSEFAVNAVCSTRLLENKSHNEIIYVKINSCNLISVA
jgi:hypothetical protein